MDYEEEAENYMVDTLSSLKKRIKKLEAALEEIKEHEKYLGVSSVYYDAQVLTIVDQALKG